MENRLTPPKTSLATQPRSLFRPGTWLTKIDFINHLALFNNMLIVVVAEKTGGKTAFNVLLQNNLDQQIKPVPITLKASCNRETLLSNIAKVLQLNYDKTTTSAALIAQINGRKEHVLCIIDDAHHLQEEVIKEIIAEIKNQNDFSFFHLCLISDYSLIPTLNAFAKEHVTNLIHTIELGCLSESECRTYVLQKAMDAHLIHRPLTSSQFKQFYLLTKGNIAKINSSLEQFIVKSTTQDEKRHITKKSTKKTSGIITTLLIVCTGLFAYFGFSTKSAVLEETKVELSAAPLIEEQLISYLPSWEDSSTRQYVAISPPTKQQIVNEWEEEETELQNTAIVDKVLVIPKIQKRLVADEVSSKASSSQLIAIAIPKEKPLAKSVNKPKVLAQRPSKAINKSKLLKPQFTIQLIASHKAQDLYRYKQGKSMLTKARIRHFVNAKGTWYVLTLGDFSNKQQAKKEMQRLPATLAKLQPWIRPVSDLVG